MHLSPVVCGSQPLQYKLDTMDPAGSDSVVAMVQAQEAQIHHHKKQLISVCVGMRELSKRHESIQAFMGSQVCHLNKQFQQISAHLETLFSWLLLQLLLRVKIRLQIRLQSHISPDQSDSLGLPGAVWCTH